MNIDWIKFELPDDIWTRLNLSQVNLIIRIFFQKDILFFYKKNQNKFISDQHI
jgi:hypothetical protein